MTEGQPSWTWSFGVEVGTRNPGCIGQGKPDPGTARNTWSVRNNITTS